MAWTTLATVTTGQLMTAAFWNQQVRDNLGALAETTMATTGNDRTFTNTSFLDLDALTGGSGTMGAVIVTVDTLTTAIVIVSANIITNSAAGGVQTLLSYRVSGATTIAAGSGTAVRQGDTPVQSNTYVHANTALTAGSNTFELQASVSGASTGRVANPSLTVIPVF